MRYFITFVVFLTLSSAFPHAYLAAQGNVSRPSMIYPIKSEPGISGNFGELRPNHFHSGVDFRSDAVTGKQVVASDDGWVSRIGISPGGYGLVLYLDHPSGLTTVYAHLKSLAPSLDSLLEEGQYALKDYIVDLTFGRGEHPVSKGELIAYSGNSGASQAPHLHYEVRETVSECALNPMDYMPVTFPDRQKPMIGGVILAPVGRQGVVNGQDRFALFGVNSASQQLSPRKQPTAWGVIQAAVRAIDKMDSNYHKFAISQARLFVDDTLVSELNVDRVDLRISRHFNGLIYYPEWAVRRGLFLSSYKQPGCLMELYTVLSPTRGAVVINQERPYRFRYEVVDHSGNSSTVEFTVVGKRQELSQALSENTQLLTQGEDHHVGNEEVEVLFSKGSLFDDMEFSFRPLASEEKNAAPCYQIGDTEMALASPVKIRLCVPPWMKGAKAGFYLARRSDDGKTDYVPSRYEDGWVEGNVREWGVFTVKADTVSPTITPVSMAAGRIRFSLVDQGSGIKRYQATLDGEFLLLQCDGKKQSVWGSVPRNRFGAARERTFLLEVEDYCGNTARYEKKVVF